MGTGNLSRTVNRAGMGAQSAGDTSWSGYQDQLKAQNVADQNRSDRVRQQTALRERYTSQTQQSRAAQPLGAAPVFTPGKQVFK